MSETTPSKYADIDRWSSLNHVLFRDSNTFAPCLSDSDNLQILREDFAILLVGANHLGCEILKNLALSGFNDIDVLDTNIIDDSFFSSTKRQTFFSYEQQSRVTDFIFKYHHIELPRAKIAAQFIMKRVPECAIMWSDVPLTAFDKSHFARYNLVICASDDIDDKRFLNAMLCDIAKTNDDCIPLIICNTQQFDGEISIFIPFITCCFECVQNENKITPHRKMTAKDCVLFVKNKMWPRLQYLSTATEYKMVPFQNDTETIICGYIQEMNYVIIIPMDVIHVLYTFLYDEKDDVCSVNGVVLDVYNPEHMLWIYHRSKERAKRFNIDGITFCLTKSIVKNVKMQIHSTNAVIASLCVNEAFKILTHCSWPLHGKFHYSGHHAINSRIFTMERNMQCFICCDDANEPVIKRWINKECSFGAFYKLLLDDKLLRLSSNPSILNINDKVLYSHSQRKLFDFSKKMSEFIEDESILKIVDKLFNFHIRVSFNA